MKTVFVVIKYFLVLPFKNHDSSHYTWLLGVVFYFVLITVVLAFFKGNRDRFDDDNQ